MMNHFHITRSFLLELNFNITTENTKDGYYVVEKKTQELKPPFQVLLLPIK